jgi:MFS superfamily sulfate permease-like transporter
MPDSPDLYRDIEAGAETIPGIVIFRFDSPIIFFNAEHFAAVFEQLLAMLRRTRGIFS